MREQASRELDDCVEYIAGDSIDNAIRLFDAAKATFEDLADSPGLGRSYPSNVAGLAGLRKWNIPGFQDFLVFYLVFEDRVEIVRVIHGARNLPDELNNTEMP
ncbi:MAG: type II toxin-antitoxin system RelE/ParE family toxin [Phycisphaeraceae bacterium]